MVRHTIDPAKAIENYDFTQLGSGIEIANLVANTQLALEQLLANREAGAFSLEDVERNDAEVDDIFVFLTSQTDPVCKGQDLCRPLGSG